MTTMENHNPNAETGSASWPQIDAAVQRIKAIDQEGVLPGEETPEGRIERFLRLFEGVKPLLTAIASLVIIPRGWRTAVSTFIKAVQAVADDLANLADDFKAGKDLSS